MNKTPIQIAEKYEPRLNLANTKGGSLQRQAIIQAAIEEAVSEQREKDFGWARKMFKGALREPQRGAELWRKVDGAEVHHDPEFYWEGHGFFVPLSQRPTPATASEHGQEKWTHEKLQGLLGISHEDRVVTDQHFENTLDEINATLQPRDKEIPTRIIIPKRPPHT